MRCWWTPIFCLTVVLVPRPAVAQGTEMGTPLLVLWMGAWPEGGEEALRRVLARSYRVATLPASLSRLDTLSLPQGRSWWLEGEGTVLECERSAVDLQESVGEINTAFELLAYGDALLLARQWVSALPCSSEPVSAEQIGHVLGVEAASAAYMGNTESLGLALRDLNNLSPGADLSGYGPRVLRAAKAMERGEPAALEWDLEGQDITQVRIDGTAQGVARGTTFRGQEGLHQIILYHPDAPPTALYIHLPPGAKAQLWSTTAARSHLAAVPKGEALPRQLMGALAQQGNHRVVVLGWEGSRRAEFLQIDVSSGSVGPVEAGLFGAGLRVPVRAGVHLGGGVLGFAGTAYGSLRLEGGLRVYKGLWIEAAFAASWVDVRGAQWELAQQRVSQWLGHTPRVVVLPSARLVATLRFLPNRVAHPLLQGGLLATWSDARIVDPDSRKQAVRVGFGPSLAGGVDLELGGLSPLMRVRVLGEAGWAGGFYLGLSGSLGTAW